MERIAQIAFFRQLAKANYSKPGWDTFTECYDTNDIDEFFEPACLPGRDPDPENILDTEAKIESLMGDLASVWADRYAEAESYCEGHLPDGTPYDM